MEGRCYIVFKLSKYHIFFPFPQNLINQRESISTNLHIDPTTKLHKEKTAESSKKILLILKNQICIKLSTNTQQGEI